jgi:NAD(P)-dependent dehydrogenase (short-subunit alcohol dehydrogenase family)
MLIVGATGSIGGEIAAQAAQAGWAIAFHGRSTDSLARGLQRLSARAPMADVAGFVADIGEANAVEALVADAGARFGRIDAVVDCVAAGPEGARLAGFFEQTDPEAYLGFAQYSLVYVQRLAHAALPWLSREGGCFIAFVSDAGIYAGPRQTMVGAARAGTIGFIRNLAAETARNKVRAHCVSPSFVAETTIAEQLAAHSAARFEQAQRRAGLGLPTPADIAPLVLFLCGDGAKRITGQIISVNGGLNT